MRHEWRNKDKISRPGFRDVLKLFTPAHSGAAPDNIDHAFQFPVVVRAGLRIGMYRDSACPELVGSCSRPVDRGSPDHAGRLWCLRIEMATRDDLHSIGLPIGLIGFARHKQSSSSSTSSQNLGTLRTLKTPQLV